VGILQEGSILDNLHLSIATLTPQKLGAGTNGSAINISIINHMPSEQLTEEVAPHIQNIEGIWKQVTIFTFY
jgi:hypothetical protein